MKAPNKNSKPSETDQEGELHLSQVASAEGAVPAAGDGADSGTTEFIRNAVQATASDNGRKLVMPKGLENIPPRVLLAIITYCYTKGVYSCSEIEEAILSDADLREQLHHEFPDNRSLRRFRRLNREAIRITLERAFGEAKHKLGHIPPDRLQAALTQAVEKLGLPAQGGETAFLVKQAVEDRIQKALFIDGMSKDMDF